MHLFFCYLFFLFFDFFWIFFHSPNFFIFNSFFCLKLLELYTMFYRFLFYHIIIHFSFSFFQSIYRRSSTSSVSTSTTQNKQQQPLQFSLKNKMGGNHPAVPNIRTYSTYRTVWSKLWCYFLSWFYLFFIFHFISLFFDLTLVVFLFGYFSPILTFISYFFFHSLFFFIFNYFIHHSVYSASVSNSRATSVSMTNAQINAAGISPLSCTDTNVLKELEGKQGMVIIWLIN